MNEQDLDFIMGYIKENYPISPTVENSEPGKKLSNILRDMISQSLFSPAQVLVVLTLASRVAQSEIRHLDD